MVLAIGSTAALVSTFPTKAQHQGAALVSRTPTENCAAVPLHSPHHPDYFARSFDMIEKAETKEITDWVNWERQAELAGYHAGRLAKRFEISTRTLRRRTRNGGAKPLRQKLRALRL